MWTRLTLDWTNATATPEELSDLLYSKDYWVAFTDEDKYLYAMPEDIPYIQVFLDNRNITFSNARSIKRIPKPKTKI